MGATTAIDVDIVILNLVGKLRYLLNISAPRQVTQVHKQVTTVAEDRARCRGGSLGLLSHGACLVSVPTRSSENQNTLDRA
jgi:hypothetical protein